MATRGHDRSAIGPRAARRYFLSAERFDARQALGLGLVSAVVPAAALGKEATKLADILCQNGPAAMAEAKRLIADVTGRPIDAALAAPQSELEDAPGRYVRE